MNPGKGISVWNVPTITDGDPLRFTDVVEGLGMQRVEIKAAHGAGVFIVSRVYKPTWGENLRPELVAALHDRGIKVWGWGFLTGADPVAEGQRAAGQVLRLKLDGWFHDGEGEFEARPGADGNARATMTAYRKLCPDTPTAFCGFPTIWSPTSGAQWHNPEVHRAFMEYCDFGMPMVYWQGKPEDPTPALQQAVDQWRRITQKPILPEGRAYIGDNGTPTPGAIAKFAAMARHSCPGVGWWGLDWAIKQPTWMAALKATEKWPVDVPPLPPPPPADVPPISEGYPRLWRGWREYFGSEP
jgi:hypothetical protein